MAFFPRVIASAALVVLGLAAAAQVKVGAPAPAFTATDSRGQTQSLNQYHGKYVVLEWHNQGCPYTRKHYVSGNMQNLQKQWTAKGVVWFTVISSAPGSQGYVTSRRRERLCREDACGPDRRADGFGWQTRPSLRRQNNAADDRDQSRRQPDLRRCDRQPATPDVNDIPSADNYVNDALTAAMAGKPVATPFTRPYGCSVKYRD